MKDEFTQILAMLTQRADVVACAFFRKFHPGISYLRPSSPMPLPEIPQFISKKQRMLLKTLWKMNRNGRFIEIPNDFLARKCKTKWLDRLVCDTNWKLSQHGPPWESIRIVSRNGWKWLSWRLQAIDHDHSQVIMPSDI